MCCILIVGIKVHWDLHGSCNSVIPYLVPDILLSKCYYTQWIIKLQSVILSANLNCFLYKKIKRWRYFDIIVQNLKGELKTFSKNPFIKNLYQWVHLVPYNPAIPAVCLHHQLNWSPHQAFLVRWVAIHGRSCRVNSHQEQRGRLCPLAMYVASTAMIWHCLVEGFLQWNQWPYVCNKSWRTSAVVWAEGGCALPVFVFFSLRHTTREWIPHWLSTQIYGGYWSGA